MKNFIYTAAVLVALGLTAQHAEAASVLFTLSSGGTSSSGGTVLTYTGGGFTLVLTGYTCGSVTLCNSVPTQTDTKTALAEESQGVGLTNDPQGSVDEIPRNEFVQVDFSAVPTSTTISSIQFNLSNIVDGFDIYGSSTAAVFDSSSGAPLAQGNNQTGSAYTANPNTSNAHLTTGATSGYAIITTSSLGYFNVTALQQDCETVLSSITVNYGPSSQGSVPEPGTCFLMGGALIGLSVFAKKRFRRS